MAPTQQGQPEYLRAEYYMENGWRPVPGTRLPMNKANKKKLLSFKDDMMRLGVTIRLARYIVREDVTEILPD